MECLAGQPEPVGDVAVETGEWEADCARRFGGVDRLYGRGAWRRLSRAHVVVVGLGGVGSWTVESLARSGVGRLTLIDLDEVCVTNINRQLPALTETVGRLKGEVLAERVRSIHPYGRVKVVPAFLTAANADALLAPQSDCVVDAVDRMSIKALILATARRHGHRVVTVGASGGKRRPEAVQVADLGASGGDELLRQVRRRLRRAHNWSRGEGQHYGVPAVFSTEPRIFPRSDGAVCLERETAESLRLDCAGGLGAVCPVTATFGMVLGSVVLRELLG